MPSARQDWLQVVISKQSGIVHSFTIPYQFVDKNDTAVVLMWINRLVEQLTFFCYAATCAPDEYRCIDGSCISILLRCDSRADCPGGDDEFQCRKCPSLSFFTCVPCFTRSKRQRNAELQAEWSVNKVECIFVTASYGNKVYKSWPEPKSTMG